MIVTKAKIKSPGTFYTHIGNALTHNRLLDIEVLPQINCFECKATNKQISVRY